MATIVLALFCVAFAAPIAAQEEVPPTTNSVAPPVSTAPPVEPPPSEPPPTAPPAPTDGPPTTNTGPALPEPSVPPDAGASREVVVTTPPNTTPGISAAEIAGIQSLYDEAIADEAVALAAYEASELQLIGIDDQVIKLEHRLGVVAGQLQLAHAKVLVAEVQLEDSEVTLNSVQSELAGEREDLRHQAVEAYVAGGRRGTAELEVFGQGLMNELAAARTYGEVLLGTQQRLIERVEALEAEAIAVAEALKRAETVANDARDEVVDKEAELRASEQQLLLLRSQVVELVATNREALAAIQSEKANYEERLNYLQTDSDGIAGVLKTRQAGQAQADILPRFSPPTAGAQPGLFGPRLHPIFNTVRMHNGIDLGAAMGDDIRAAAAGTVVYAQQRQGYGLVTVIDHGNQIATLYAHQSSFAVIEGQEVGRGELIGLIGSTGYSTGPHLHFEVRLLGDPINPNSLIAFGEPWPTPCDVLRISENELDQINWEGRVDCQAALLDEARGEPEGQDAPAGS